MRKCLFTTVLAFALGMGLVFWSLNLNLLGGEYSAKAFDAFAALLNMLNPPEETQIYGLAASAGISQNDFQGFLFIAACSLGVVVVVLSIFTRLKFGKHRLFPASAIAGVCLCYIAIERGVFIGVL